MLDLEPIRERYIEYLKTGPWDSPDQMGEDLNALITEVTRLRAALKRISLGSHPASIRIAREALEPPAH